MTSYIGKKIARKAFAGQAAGLEPADPHYETYVDQRGRTKSRKRKMPAGLSKRDERILRSVRRRAHYLDKGFTLCGFRFGWTAILGLIPLAGDIASFLLGYFLVLRKCRQADLPFSLSQRMAFNQAVSLGIGLVPMVGDLCAAVWKTNSRNAALLEEFLIQRAAKDSEGNKQTEEQAAVSVLASSHINPLTGRGAVDLRLILCRRRSRGRERELSHPRGRRRSGRRVGTDGDRGRKRGVGRRRRRLRRREEGRL
ncbi:hypothetical protein BCR35DRAFT_296166 [Leucosporidium creatinivorum]|uniref:Uncharacterized protein n=1 Tax=Leucosporidium creatinivorum TaxID=106004 RepID=A0A1Y2DC33_9BASI|nr:hypothetical protein BCR35DRAFT_296166 [Leucosporidium creatinivorum]